MARVLVLGATGMLGHMACRILGESHDTWGSVRGSRMADRLVTAFDPDRIVSGVDSGDLSSVERAIDTTAPDVVLNCIGVIKQSDLVADPVLTIESNALFPHQLAALCRASGARLIHMSTDCVFSGRAGPYDEDAVPDPIDLYGRSKLLGELSVEEGLTIRTSIIGRQLFGDLSLIEWARGQRGTTISGYTNAIFSGLTTEYLARVIDQVITEADSISGVWQVSSPPISKFDLLSLLNSALDLDLRINPAPDFVIDRSLLSDRFWMTTGMIQPTWDEMIASLAIDEEFYRGVVVPGGSR